MGYYPAHICHHAEHVDGRILGAVATTAPAWTANQPAQQHRGNYEPTLVEGKILRTVPRGSAGIFAGILCFPWYTCISATHLGFINKMTLQGYCKTKFARFDVNGNNRPAIEQAYSGSMEAQSLCCQHTHLTRIIARWTTWL